MRESAARLLLALGRAEEAQAVAATGRTDEEVALLRQWGSPSALGVSLRIRGERREAAGVADRRNSMKRATGSAMFRSG